MNIPSTVPANFSVIDVDLEVQSLNIPDAELDLNYFDGVTTETESGEIVSFENPMTLPLPFVSVKADITAQQDLHGQANPYPAGGGKNKFNYENTSISLSNLGRTGAVFSNTDTDTRNFFNMQIRALNNGTIVEKSTAQAITQNGRKSATITVSSAITSIAIVHNGSQRNLQLAYPFTEQGTFTVSFDVTGYDPRTVGGLSFTNVQIESGSTATDFAPYSNICPITGFTGANVYVRGVNQWDEEWELGDINASTGQNVNSVTTIIRSKNYIPVLPLTEYFFKIGTGSSSNIRARFYDRDKNYIGSASANSSHAVTYNSVFITPADCYYMRFTPQTTYGTIYNNDISINYPSTDHDYHAYNGEDYATSFGSTVYGGTLNVKTGVLTVTRAFYKGGWTQCASSNGYKAYRRTLLPAKGSGKITGGGICNMLDNWGSFSSSSMNRNIIQLNVSNAAGNGYLALVETANAEDLEVCYLLAIPTEVQLTPTEVKTLLGQNNIWADTGEVEVTYYTRG